MFAARKTDNVSSAANYIEDVFSTYLYTGTDLTQSRRITNNIALGTGVSFVVYENAYGGSLNGSFVAQTGDVIIFYALHSSGSTVSFTLNGSSKTAQTTRTDGNGYWHGVYIENLASGDNTFTSGGVSLGFTSAVVIRGASSVSVATNLANAGATDSFTTTSFSTTGFGLFLISDRDPTATPTISGSSQAFDAQYTYFRSRFLAVSGNGTTVASQTCTGMVAADQGSYCGIKIEGMGATVPVTTGSGGMVWLKGRSGATAHALYDTARGATFDLASNSTAAQTTETTGLTSFNGNGFSIGSLAKLNTNGTTYASWTFRKQAKFFDVVTYTGNGSATRTISHNLGSVPGFIIIKERSAIDDWCVLAGDSSGNYQYLYFNTAASSGSVAKSSVATSTTIDIAPIRANYGTNAVNEASQTYVMYLFAHDAGGFGATGTDNVISCGSFSANANTTVNLGWEPQFILWKNAQGTNNWGIADNMRGLDVSGTVALLNPNTASAESSSASTISINSTGFTWIPSASGNTYIYIAIRRGPMKTPTSGTSVYNAISRTGTGASTAVTGVGFSPDLALIRCKDGRATDWFSKLIGFPVLRSAIATEEVAQTTELTAWGMDGVSFGASLNTAETNPNNVSIINWYFRRAPGFCDVVCYTGTGANRTVSHNLQVVPELMIVKRRDLSASWYVYTSTTGNTKYIPLNDTATPTTTSSAWNNTDPTSSVFTVSTSSAVNASGGTYVAYLFATVGGISKVGSYTGNGSSQTINCGFAAGARFILIKRTDSTGDWYVWDTARGIVAGNDPRLSLNSAAAEVTTDDSIDPDNSGFIVNQLAATNINVSSATYIYLAIA